MILELSLIKMSVSARHVQGLRTTVLPCPLVAKLLQRLLGWQSTGGASKSSHKHRKNGEAGHTVRKDVRGRERGSWSSEPKETRSGLPVTVSESR